MKSLSELKSIVPNALDDTILYETETSDTNNENMILLFYDSKNDTFECEDFEKNWLHSSYYTLYWNSINLI